jgi:hypothetical protein
VCLPAFLELREQTVGAAYGVGVADHALGAAVLPLGDQARPFQYGDVLLHCGKGHVVASSQLGDGRFRDHHPRQDVTSRRIGEGPEQLIQRLARRRSSMYNHLVVYHSTPPPTRNRTGIIPAEHPLRHAPAGNPCGNRERYRARTCDRPQSISSERRRHRASGSQVHDRIVRVEPDEASRLSRANAVSATHAGTRLRYSRSPPWMTTSTSPVRAGSSARSKF